MNKYLVTAISDDLMKECGGNYAAALEKAETVVLIGLNAVFEYCGGKLYKGRCGFSGYNYGRGIDYTAVRIE